MIWSHTFEVSNHYLELSKLRVSYIEGVQIKFVILLGHVFVGTLPGQLLGSLLTQSSEIILLVKLRTLVPIELVIHLVIVSWSGVFLCLRVVVYLNL